VVNINKELTHCYISKLNKWYFLCINLEESFGIKTLVKVRHSAQ